MKEVINVLVVDDDRRMVKTICDILKFKGFNTETAYCGEDAVEKVKTMDLDCVLMDMKMPGIGGVGTLRIIKTLAPDLPVVLMSAYATKEQAKEAKYEGAYTILTKQLADIQLMLSFLFILKKEKSILIVDDDPGFCKTLQNILQSRDYQVETETDPQKVLGHMEQRYELAVVLDLKLGDADGLETLERIRARYPTKPVILITGYREEMTDAIRKGLRTGAYACFYKPFEAEELIGTIEEIGVKKLQALLGESFQDKG